MEVATGLGEVAEFFKVLGNESRLGLLYLISQQPRTVGQLAEATGMSQPLVSQHLRTLRQARLIAGTRIGREIPYRLADNHVVHVMADALLHVQELEAGQPADPTTTTATPHQGEDMTNDTHTEHHTVTEHEHGTDCGHETVQHDDHVDYMHDGHKHALHGDHYDEH